jgi:hypothetical protein
MKKYFTIFTVLFITLFAFISCDTDATNGILSEIVNSETEEDFELIAVSANDDASIIYSVEDDGIYQSDTTSLERTLILDTSDYLNVFYLYLDDTNDRLWFNYYDLDDSTTYLAYMDPSDSATDPTTVSYDGTFIEITSNGYVIGKDTTYYASSLDDYDDSGSISADITFGSSSDSLDDTIVVDDDTIIVQTVEIIDEDDDENEFTFYIYDGNGTTISTGSTTLDYKVIAAVEDTGDPGLYFFVTSDASFYSYDINSLSDKLNQLFENDDDDYYFNMESQKMFVNGQYIVVFDEDLYVLCYDTELDESDYSDLDADDLYLSEGFANTLSSTSDIVGIFAVDDDDNDYLDDDDDYDFYCYVATNENGYYFVGMDKEALSDDDSDYSESESLSFTLVTE